MKNNGLIFYMWHFIEYLDYIMKDAIMKWKQPTLKKFTELDFIGLIVDMIS